MNSPRPPAPDCPRGQALVGALQRAPTTALRRARKASVDIPLRRDPGATRIPCSERAWCAAAPPPDGPSCQRQWSSAAARRKRSRTVRCSVVIGRRCPGPTGAHRTRSDTRTGFIVASPSARAVLPAPPSATRPSPHVPTPEAADRHTRTQIPHTDAAGGFGTAGTLNNNQPTRCLSHIRPEHTMQALIRRGRRIQPTAGGVAEDRHVERLIWINEIRVQLIASFLTIARKRRRS